VGDSVFSSGGNPIDHILFASPPRICDHAAADPPKRWRIGANKLARDFCVSSETTVHAVDDNRPRPAAPSRNNCFRGLGED
jgi:hypothetical protein